MIVQILIVFFSLFALAKLWKRYRKNEINWFEFTLWIIFWGLAIVAAIKPDITNVIAKVVGIGRGADLVVYTALIILFYIVFKLLGRLYKLEREITFLVQHIALDKQNKKAGNKESDS